MSLALTILRVIILESPGKNADTSGDRMDPLLIIGFCLLGLATGTISGLLGIGGAVVIIPILVYIFGFDQRTAQGTSLALMLPPIGLLAVLSYHKSGHIKVVPAAIIALTFMIGGFIGSRLSLKVDVNVLRKGFACLLLITAVRLFLKH